VAKGTKGIPMIRRIVYLLFFLSGFCGLVYELVWLRKLALIFGNTTIATSVVLFTFMAGLAAGSMIFGRLIDRQTSALKWYGQLELGIAVSALIILYVLIPLSNYLYVFIFQSVSTSDAVLTLARFFFASLLLIVPTTLMGGTLPIISKSLIQEERTLGAQIGRLYSLNTFGGVLGVFCTAFYLLRGWGEDRTLWLAILLNALIGIIALQLAKRQQAAAAPIKKNDAVQPTVSKPSRVSAPAVSSMIVWLFALAGFASLAYEVVWTRALLFFVSSSTYSFALILAAFLLGIALGSQALAIRVDKLRRPLWTFALVEGCIAVYALFSILLMQNMEFIQVWLLQFLHVSQWSHIVFFLTLSVFVLLLIPAFCMGAAFPIVTRIYITSLPPLGDRIGRVYMYNTAGGILGSLCAGFVLLPWLGINGSIIFLACINWAAATIAYAYENDDIGSKKMRLAFGFAALALVILIGVNVSHRSSLFQQTTSFQKSKVLYYEDASAATLSVLERADDINPWGRNVRLLNINGNNTAHTTFSDIIIHKMLAHLPMLIHPEPQSALVIGFGLGNTCHSFLQYPVLQQLDCVELVKEEKFTAQFFREENQGVFDDPRFHYIVNDGRNYILATSRTYDVISTNAVDPKYSPMLYTEEFYRLAKKKLNENGLLVAWLPLYGMSQSEVLALIKSAVAVFPNTTLWYNNPEHMLLLASDSPLSIDYRHLSAAMKIPTVKASLQQIFLDNPDALLSTFFMGDNSLNELVEDSSPHTDQHPIVEFSRVASRMLDPELYRSLMSKKENVSRYCQGMTAEDGQRLHRYEMSMYEMLKGLYQYHFVSTPAFLDTAQTQQALKLMKQAIDQVPENDFNLIYFLDWVQQRDLQDVVPYLDRAIQRAPRFAKAIVLHGLAQSQRGNWQSALQDYQTATAINANYVSALFNAGVAQVNMQQWPQAAQSMNRVIQIQPENVFAHSTLAQMYYMLKDYPKALQHASRSIELLPSQANSYFNQGAILEKMGDIPKAIRAFEKGLQLAPTDARAQQKLQQLKSRTN
jgi:spermidine synthase